MQLSVSVSAEEKKLERSNIYLLWYRDECITYFEENELEDLFELIIDLNFEEAYWDFLYRIHFNSNYNQDIEDAIAEALHYCTYAEGWHWFEVEKNWR